MEVWEQAKGRFRENILVGGSMLAKALCLMCVQCLQGGTPMARALYLRGGIIGMDSEVADGFSVSAVWTMGGYWTLLDSGC